MEGVVDDVLWEHFAQLGRAVVVHTTESMPRRTLLTQDLETLGVNIPN